MSKRRIEMLDIKHLLRLKKQGRSNRQIGDVLGIHRNTVNSYITQFKTTGKTYSELYGLEDSALLALINPPEVELSARYKCLLEQFSGYERELKKVGATMQTLWEGYCEEAENPYGYTQFRKHFKSYLKQKKVSLHWEHKFGDKLFIDFSGKKLPVRDKVTGEVIWKSVFVGVLGGSSYTFVQAAHSEGLDDFLEVVQDCFHYLGGVTQALVPDNLKSAVTVADRYEAEVNRNFKALALHYGTVVLPTRSREPKDKALAEGAVKLAYQRIFYPLNELTFYSLKDLNAAIRTELDKHNNKLFQEHPYSRRGLFEQEEKHLLERLPTERFERRTYRQGRVNKDGHVRFDYHYYSVPYQYTDKRIWVQATARGVEVFRSSTHERIAVHKRSCQKGGFTTKREHLPDNVRFVKDWSVEQFTDQGAEMGECVYGFFLKIFEHKAHPEQGYKACMGILNLRKGFSDQRINAACKRADYFENYSYKTIKNILEKGLDKVGYQPHAQTDNQPELEASHPNIRGGEYYQ